VNSALPCKEFSGAINRGGYGVMRHEGRAQLAHRVAYCESQGIPIEQIAGLVVRHDCDNRRCCEPSHLQIGTQLDNVRDMHERRRNSPPPHHSGERHPASKLTLAQVRDIRANAKAGAKQLNLARRYGVSAQTICSIVKGDTWDELICELNAAIAPLSITADGLAQLGFRPVGQERAAKLYAGEDFPRICAALQQVIQQAPERVALKAAA
jgi:DNA-binding XRE family transcriptional regulator